MSAAEPQAVPYLVVWVTVVTAGKGQDCSQPKRPEEGGAFGRGRVNDPDPRGQIDGDHAAPGGHAKVSGCFARVAVAGWGL